MAERAVWEVEEAGPVRPNGKQAEAEQAVEKEKSGPVIVDIPMRWGPGSPPEGDAEPGRCTYMVGGKMQCPLQAGEGRELCERHWKWVHRMQYGIPITCPEDRETVKMALQETMSLVLAHFITPQEALAVVAICRAILAAR